MNPTRLPLLVGLALAPTACSTDTDPLQVAIVDHHDSRDRVGSVRHNVRDSDDPIVLEGMDRAGAATPERHCEMK
jgi:hypothetical protein